MPVMFSRMIRTMSSTHCCTFSYRGMPFQDTNTTSPIMMGARMHRTDASPTSMVSVIAMPPISRIGARTPMAWKLRMKFCTL